jgi:hypothetical protein
MPVETRPVETMPVETMPVAERVSNCNPIESRVITKLCGFVVTEMNRM